MILEVCLLVLPQGGADWLKIETPAVGEPVVVSAMKDGITARSAIRDLATRMSWEVAVESESVEEQLGEVSLSLAFTKQPPKIVAHLIAVSAGLDVAFSELEQSTEMHVISAPTGETETGRARLRQWAIHWYQQFLADDPTVAYSPVAQEKGMEALMHLGRLLLQDGELENAVEVYNRIFEEDESQVYVPMALLRMAEVHRELGGQENRPDAEQASHREQAERFARMLSNMNPELGPTAEASVLLAELLMEQERYSECIRFLEGSTLALSKQPEIVDIYLLIAECHSYGELPARTVSALDTLAGSQAYRDMSRSQWLDYHYLRGLGAEALARTLESAEERSDRFAESMQSLEYFIGHGENDPRRGAAFVALGRVYLELGKFIQSRYASNEALRESQKLDDEWLTQARILEVNSLRRLGEREAAWEKLEFVVRPNPELMPDLVMFLVDTLIDGGRFDRAVSNADLLTGQDGAVGDEARYRKILAMYKQAQLADDLQAFPAKAIEIAKQMSGDSRELEQKVSQIIGQAYESLNMIGKAADAYRGILR